MKTLLCILLLISCISCSDEADFYTVESFNDQFTNGLFISKLKANSIPYQFDYKMGSQYVLVHANFQKSVIKLRKDSLIEAKSLSLINLENECSQQKLSQQFKQSTIFHMTLTKRSIPMIRVTNNDHNSKKVSTILNKDDWRCS